LEVPLIKDKYIYNINYSDSEVELAYLEMRTVFKENIGNKIQKERKIHIT
jgi:hypothetical protein